MKNNVFTFEEITPTDVLKLQQGRKLFISYFGDLYKDQSPAQLQIKGETAVYLASIFDKTEKNLKNDPSLHAVLIYQNQIPVGFATFGLLEDTNIILIRTVAIAVNHKDIEQELRLSYINFIYQKYLLVSQIVMMIRKTNKYHQEVVRSIGFKVNNEVFKIAYINKVYDKTIYNVYSINKS